MTKHCILSAGSNDNPDINRKNIIFIIKDTKLYVPVVALSAKDNRKLSKLLIKGIERSAYWNKYKTKFENENTTNNYRHFLESNFVGHNRLFIFIYSKKDDNAEVYKARMYHLPKSTISFIMLSSMEKPSVTNPLILI